MIVLLASSGYIGSEFASSILDRYGSIGTPSRQEYSQFDRLRRYLKATNASLVINCAAFVTKPSVDLCEDHKAETLMGNLVLPAIITNACQATDTPLLHVSTGCLFNGDNGGKGYTEKDAPQLTFDTGCGYYVGSKQLAEQVVYQYEKAFICRIRIPFDGINHERNYLSKLQYYPKIYSNLNSLSHRRDFVKTCLGLWENRAPFGVYNCTNPGAITAREIVGMMNKYLTPREYEFWDEAEFMMAVAKTPKSNCVLNVDKLLSTGLKIRYVHEAVEDSLKHWHV